MRRRFIALLIVIAVLSIRVPTVVQAQTVPLDPNFGTGGIVSGITVPGYVPDCCYHRVHALSDGRILAGIRLNHSVGGDLTGFVRYSGRGEVDTTFGTLGNSIIDWYPNESQIVSQLGVDRLGRIIATASLYEATGNDWGLAVLTASGIQDSTFDQDGVMSIVYPGNGYAADFAVDTDNNIVVTGNVLGSNGAPCPCAIRLTRFSPDGTPDNTLSVDFNGYLFPSLTADAQGRIVIAAPFFSSPTQRAVWRRLPSGAADTTFSGDGMMTDTIPGTFWVRAKTQSDNKIVLITSESSPTFYVSRYTTTGELDLSYGASGRTTITVGASPADALQYSMVDSQDRVLLLSYVSRPSSGYDIVLVRLTSAGIPDPTFGVNGVMNLGPAIGSIPGRPSYFTEMPDGDLVILAILNSGLSLIRLDLGDPAELIQNPSFETADSTQAGNAQKWAGANLTKDKRTCNTISPPVTYAHTGSCAFLFKGGSGEKSQISQTIKPDAALRQAGTALTLSAWVEGAPNYILGKVVAYYTDGTKQAFSVAMGPALSYTQFTSAPFFLAKNASKFKVSFKHTYPSGWLYLDDVALIPNAARRDGVLPVPDEPFGAGAWRTP